MFRASSAPIFPTTPHLRGSCGTWDDTFLDQETTQRILSSALIVQEKIDGINIGFHLTGNRLVVIHKDRVLPDREFGRLTELYGWCRAHARALKEVLQQGVAVFGEYVGHIHRTTGEKPPWFVFDGYDIAAGRFLAQVELRQRITALPVLFAPTLFQGVPGQLSKIQSLIGRSVLGTGPMEGVYIRVEHGTYLQERYKFVRADYVKVAPA
jgi:RNA ligase-like protein